MACIHDEIAAMPGGYDARVAERGQNLSGGQRQRLALARVFLKNPPILILDEGTSALDNISERQVQQAINAARADRTVILVAHRLTTLLDTDRIFVIDDGRVVETGHLRGARRARRRLRRAGPLGRRRGVARPEPRIVDPGPRDRLSDPVKRTTTTKGGGNEARKAKEQPRKDADEMASPVSAFGILRAVRSPFLFLLHFRRRSSDSDPTLPFVYSKLRELT